MSKSNNKVGILSENKSWLSIKFVGILSEVDNNLSEEIARLSEVVAKKKSAVIDLSEKNGEKPHKFKGFGTYNINININVKLCKITINTTVTS